MTKIVVGNRYVLNPPALRKGAVLYGLVESLNSFTDRGSQVDGKDPVMVAGIGRTVMARDTGYRIDTSTKSSKRSEPGVLIRLAREQTVRGRVKLGWADIDGLGLDPAGTYWVSGFVERRGEFGDFEFAGIPEEKEFIIPESWLGSIEEAAAQLEKWRTEREARLAAYRMTNQPGPGVGPLPAMSRIRRVKP